MIQNISYGDILRYKKDISIDEYGYECRYECEYECGLCGAGLGT